MGRTPVNSAKRSVSSESVGIPDDQPWMFFLPWMSWIGETSIGSGAAPTTTMAPLSPRPSISEDIAFELGAVARMARAPPSFCNSAAAFFAALSIYTLAPSFFASILPLSGPSSTASRRGRLHRLSLLLRVPARVDIQCPARGLPLLTHRCDRLHKPARESLPGPFPAAEFPARQSRSRLPPSLPV